LLSRIDEKEVEEKALYYFAPCRGSEEKNEKQKTLLWERKKKWKTFSTVIPWKGGETAVERHLSQGRGARSLLFSLFPPERGEKKRRKEEKREIRREFSSRLEKKKGERKERI